MIGPWVVLCAWCWSYGAVHVDAMPVADDPMLYPFVCLNPIGADDRPIRYCGGKDRLGLSWVLVLDHTQCRYPSRLAVSVYPMKGHERSFWVDSGMYQWIADWDGPLDADRDGDWDVDDIQTVLWAIEGAELPGPRLGDICPPICSDGTIDVQDLMATIFGFEGHFECGW